MFTVHQKQLTNEHIDESWHIYSDVIGFFMQLFYGFFALTITSGNAFPSMNSLMSINLLVHQFIYILPL